MQYNTVIRCKIAHKKGVNAMTFKQAYEYAMQASETFRKHDARVKEAAERKEQSPCLVFSVSAGETFYYGFDGVEVQRGKHSGRRASKLQESGHVLIIL